MESDQGLWEKACKRVRIFCDGCRRREIATNAGPPFYERHPPFDHYPAIGDAEATVKLWNHLRRETDSVQWRRLCDSVRLALNDAEIPRILAAAVLGVAP